MAKKIFIVRSNISGSIKGAYTTKELAKKKKGRLEHIREIFLEDKDD